MGAGTAPAGQGGAGLNLLPALSPPRNVTPPISLRFDGATADFQLDDQGRYKSIHPVDQAVALALLVRLGTLGSVPSMGAGFRNIRKIGPTTPNQVENMARVALARLVQAQSIKILSIQVETKRKPGSIAIAVSYTNLRTNPAKPETARVTING